jgi:hypothetical protein
VRLVLKDVLEVYDVGVVQGLEHAYLDAELLQQAPEARLDVPAHPAPTHHARAKPQPCEVL